MTCGFAARALGGPSPTLSLRGRSEPAGRRFPDTVEVCPACLPDELERGEALLVNPEEIARVLAEWSEEAPTA
jgi:hypothetical protein